MGEGIIAVIKFWAKKHVHLFVHLSHLKGMKTSSDGCVSAALRTWLVQLPHRSGSSFFLCGPHSYSYCLFKAFLSDVSQLVSGFMHWSPDNNVQLSSWHEGSSEG